MINSIISHCWHFFETPTTLWDNGLYHFGANYIYMVSFLTGPALKVLSMELVPPNKVHRVFQLVKVKPKLLSGKRIFLMLLEPKGVFSIFL